MNLNALIRDMIFLSFQVFGDYYHFQHRTVVKRSLSDHRGTHVRLLKDPKVRRVLCLFRYVDFYWWLREGCGRDVCKDLNHSSSYCMFWRNCLEPYKWILMCEWWWRHAVSLSGLITVSFVATVSDNILTCCVSFQTSTWRWAGPSPWPLPRYI